MIKTPSLDQYDQLVARVDAHCGRITLRLAGEMACRIGCDACCRRIGLFPVEAAAVTRALGRLDPMRAAKVAARAMRRTDTDMCPLLLNGQCAIYESRPIICRTHGLPIYAAEDADGPRVDCCPRNFIGRRKFSSRELIDIDALNRMLAGVNRLFMAERSGQANAAPFSPPGAGQSGRISGPFDAEAEDAPRMSEDAPRIDMEQIVLAAIEAAP